MGAGLRSAGMDVGVYEVGAAPAAPDAEVGLREWLADLAATLVVGQR